ncbi:MAG: hypothetical protein ACI9Y1_002353, partial [Lentisphaeria bacterium]
SNIGNVHYLRKKREVVLGFTDVLEEKFTVTSQQFSVPIQSVWAMCELQRCAVMEHQHTQRSETLKKIRRSIRWHRRRRYCCPLSYRRHKLNE